MREYDTGDWVIEVEDPRIIDISRIPRTACGPSQCRVEEL